MELISIMVGFELPDASHTEVSRLIGAERGQLDAELVEMEPGDFLVEMFRKHVDLVLVGPVIGPQLDLGEHLVGEGGAHDKARVTGGATEIDQPSLGKDDQALAVGKDDFVDLRLNLFPRIVAQGLDLDFAVEMADVAD